MSENHMQTDSGLQPSQERRRSYTGVFKAKVVAELIHGKKDIKELAEEYDLHPNQIKNWKSTLIKRSVEIFEDKRRKRS